MVFGLNIFYGININKWFEYNLVLIIYEVCIVYIDYRFI